MPSRQTVQWAKFRVTLVAVCGLSILTVLMYLLTGGTLFEAKAILYIHLPDATGVVRGAPVRLNGIFIGKVHSVNLTGSTDPDKIVLVALTVETERLANIPIDSYAQASADSVVGDKFVEITKGRHPQHVTPNSEI